jgi:hypothetical protein
LREKIAADQAPGAEADSLQANFPLAREDQILSFPQTFLRVVEAPAVIQKLVHTLAQAGLVIFLKTFDRNCKLLSCEIQHRSNQANALRGRKAGDFRQFHPQLIAGSAFLESPVFDFEKSALFEIGVNDAPRPAQVFVDPVFDQVTKDPANRLSRRRIRIQARVLCNLLEGYIESFHSLLGDIVEGKLSIAFQCATNSGAKKTDEYKVIEMAGLQRGILTVVGEAEQLARGTLNARARSMLKESNAEGRGGGAAAFV